MQGTVSALSPNLSLLRSVRKPVVRSRAGIVVTQNRAASEVGARVLAAGGHAVDAAVAAAFAVGVVEPWMSGIGGVGAMLVYEAAAGRISGIDFGARSPKSLDPKAFVLTNQRDEGNLFGWPMVVGNVNTVGPKAVVAPTVPAGLAAAHRRYGRKPWRDLVAPAIAIAEQGPIVDWHTTLVIATAMADLARNPGARARFLPNGYPPLAPAAVEPDPVKHLPMPDLARTLRAIADDGADVLYTGALARSIADDIKEMGGYLGVEDLAAVRASEVEPLSFGYLDRTVHVLPKLNGGPTLRVAFAELARQRETPEASPDTRTFLAYASALRSAWQDRFENMGDAGRHGAPTSHHAPVRRRSRRQYGDADADAAGPVRLPHRAAPHRHPDEQRHELVQSGAGRPQLDRPGPRRARQLRAGHHDRQRRRAGHRRLRRPAHPARGVPAAGDVRRFRALAWTRPSTSRASTFPASTWWLATGACRPRPLPRSPHSFQTVLAEPVEYPFPYTIAGAVRRSAAVNEGATEPQHPWSEAVAEQV